MQGKLVSFLLSLFFLLPFTINAQTTESYVIVAPKCILKNLSDYSILSTQDNLTLIKVNAVGFEQLMEAKAQQRAPCGFMDVTSEWNQYATKHFSGKNTAKSFLTTYSKPVKTNFPNPATEPKYEKEVNQLLKQLNPQFLINNLTYLSSFQDRYANSDTGVQTAEWLKTQIETLAKNNNRTDVTVYFVPTGTRFKQSSVVAKFGSGSDAGIVIGAHMDTLNGANSKKPGADDDGSGTVTVLETARIILESGMNFKKPIYFIWYAAEEEGLVGSKYVVSDFKTKNIPVQAVLHYDMTGYTYPDDPSVWLITDYVNKDLVTYLEMLIKTYVKQPIKYTRCGYPCSDHASWTLGGIPAAIPAETAYRNTNPNMHSSTDTIDKLLINHMTDYAKLAVAFVVESAEPQST